MIPVPVIPLPDLTGHDDTYSDTDTYATFSSTVVDFPDTITVRVEQPPTMPFVDHTGSAHEASVADWDSYVGQEPAKRQLRVFIDSALATMTALPHVLLNSKMPGVGKTTLARLIAKELGVKITSMVPPFSAEALYEAMLQMQDWDILFIDEIHLLADQGHAEENLLTAMEEGMIYLPDGVHRLKDFTIIGASTEANKLKRPVLDRFAIKPYFQRYTDRELVRIAHTNFCKRFDVELAPATLAAVALACRSTPRFARDLVQFAKALQDSLGRQCTPDELLAFAELEPDGMGREHIAYVTGMLQFGRSKKADDTYEFKMGEATLLMMLDQDKYGLAQIERFLILKGLVDKTRAGRVLTDRGITQARLYLAQGKSLPTG